MEHICSNGTPCVIVIYSCFFAFLHLKTPKMHRFSPHLGKHSICALAMPGVVEIHGHLVEEVVVIVPGRVLGIFLGVLFFEKEIQVVAS